MVAAAIQSRVGLFGLPDLDPLGHHTRALLADVAFHRTQAQLYVSDAGKLQLWMPTADLRPERTLTFVAGEGFDGLAGSIGVIADAIDSSSMVALVNHGELRIWINRDSVPAKGVGEGGPIQAVAWCPESRRIAAVRKGGQFVEFHAVPGHEVSRLDLPGAEVMAVAAVLDGRELAIRTRDALLLVGLPDGRELSRLPLPAPSERAAVTASADGSMFATQNANGELVIVAAGPDRRLTGPVLRLISNTPRASTVLSFGGSGGTSLVVGTEDGYLQVWHLRLAREGLVKAGLDWTPALSPAAPTAPMDPVTSVRWIGR
jgi:hypothetical protein